MNNEEKILALLEQVISDVSELKQGQSKLEQSQSKLETRLDKLETTVRSIDEAMIRFENEYIPLTRAAKEGFESVRERNKDHGKRLTKVEDKVEKHDGEIGALKIVVGQH